MPGLRSTPWCHFTFPTGDTPAWLSRLSTKAKLPKALVEEITKVTTQ